jgi:serine/threonine protein kinase
LIIDLGFGEKIRDENGNQIKSKRHCGSTGYKAPELFILDGE